MQAASASRPSSFSRRNKAIWPALLVKGEDEEANASKPVCFVAVGDEASFGDARGQMRKS